MAIWNRKKVSPIMVNSGKQYVNKVDSPSADDFNAAENNAFYAVDFAEALADAPDISELENAGTPTVSFVDNPKLVNGENIIYKKLKFSNMGMKLGVTSTTAYRGDYGKIAYDHTNNDDNPHGVTKTQVGLENVDDTADTDKPVSTAQADAIATKVNINGGETGETKTTFTEAIARTNLISGETLKTMFGKIKKFFTDLGELAFKSSLAYSELAGKPTLGALAAKDSLAYVELTNKPTLGTAAYKDVGSSGGDVPTLNTSGKLALATIPTGTVQNTVPLIGAGGKISRYLVPTANDSGYVGVVAGQNFANRNKAGATYHEVLIDSAGMAYAFYPIVDTAMSDSSINLVQNKIVKAYVDTAESSAKAYADNMVGDIETLLAGV